MIVSEISSASRGSAWDDIITITSWFRRSTKRIARECRAQIARRLANIRVPLVPVVHLSSRKEGREDTGIPCIGASILRDFVDPRGGDDLLSPHAPPSARTCPRRPRSRAVAQMPPAHRGAPNRSTVTENICRVAEAVLFQRDACRCAYRDAGYGIQDSMPQSISRRV